MKLLATIFIGMGLAHLFHLPAVFGVVLALVYYFKTNSIFQASWQSFSSHSAPTNFHQNLFSLLGYIAKADGVVSKNEISAAQKIMDELCLNYSQKTLAKAAFKKGSQGLNLNNLITYLRILNFSRPDLVQSVFSNAEKIIYAEKLKCREQINILNQIRFHIYQQQNQQFHQQPTYRPQSSLNNAYKTLGIKPDMDFSTMKRTYQKLVGKHHPDRQRDDKARKQAEEKIKSMQQAWNVIKQHHAKETA